MQRLPVCGPLCFFYVFFLWVFLFVTNKYLLHPKTHAYINTLTHTHHIHAPHAHHTYTCTHAHASERTNLNLFSRFILFVSLIF